MEDDVKRIDEQTPEGDQPQDPRAVWLYSDGVYRWAYEKDLIKNRFEINYILKIVMLVFGLSWVLIAGTILFAMGGRGGTGWVFALITGICVGAGLLSAGIILLVQRFSANARGGVDVVCFEMDEKGVRQILSEKTQKVDSALEIMTALSGLASRNLYAATNSRQIVSGTHPDITSYADVRKVRVHPEYDVIDVTLKGNYKCRVYVRGEDRQFVRDYICARAPERATRRAGG